MDILYDVLYKKNGFFYLWGQAGAVPDSAKQVVIETLKAKAGMNDEDAENYFTKMRIDGRYNLDVC